MINTLLFVHLIIAILLVVVILLQKTSDNGLSGIGGGNGNMGLVSGKSATNFLSKTTVILAIMFFCNALILANLSSQPRGNLTTKMESSESNTTNNSTGKETLPMAK